MTPLIHVAASPAAAVVVDPVNPNQERGGRRLSCTKGEETAEEVVVGLTRRW